MFCCSSGKSDDCGKRVCSTLALWRRTQQWWLCLFSAEHCFGFSSTSNLFSSCLGAVFPAFFSSLCVFCVLLFLKIKSSAKLPDLVHLSTLQAISCSVETGTRIWGCTQQGLLPGDLIFPWMISHSLEKQLFPFSVKKKIQSCAWTFTFF